MKSDANYDRLCIIKNIDVCVHYILRVYEKMEEIAMQNKAMTKKFACLMLVRVWETDSSGPW